MIPVLMMSVLLTACGGSGGNKDTAAADSDALPAITLTGASDVHLLTGEVFTDPGATAEDAEDGDLTRAITTVSSVDTMTPGTYRITYSVTDSDNNTVSTERTIYVTDSTSEHYQVSWLDKFTLPEQDADGWSILKPSSDSRIIYVSSTAGNDDTAIVYDMADSTVSSTLGSDVFHPSGVIFPYASIEAAIAQMRNGYPDYVLFKRGDRWNDGGLTISTKGRSANERAVIGAYGDTTLERPLIVNGGTNLNKSAYLALLDLHLNRSDRNPDSADFVGFNKVDDGTKGIGATLASPEGGFLIEGCWFEWFANNVIQSLAYDADKHLLPVSDIIVRRNIFNNNYSTTAHAQGIYAAYSSMLVEENIFDHNGWYKQGDGATTAEGKATLFNHNTYFVDSTDTIFRNNLFLRSSSIGTKFTSNTMVEEGIPNQIRAWNILVDNNFYAEGEVVISLGGNKDQDNGPRWANIIVYNNVATAIGRTFPTSRTLGWGIGISDWKGGLVQNNLMFNWGKKDVYTNTYGLNAAGHLTNTIIDSNIVYGIATNTCAVKLTNESGNFENPSVDNITFTNNEITLTEDLNGSVMHHLIKPTEQTFANNTYWLKNANDDGWFMTSSYYSFDGITDNRTVTFPQLMSVQEDNTSVQQEIDYVDTTRTIGGYLQSANYASGLNSDTEMDKLVALLKTQRKGNWSGDLTAAALNSYFRAGFCVNGRPDCR